MKVRSYFAAIGLCLLPLFSQAGVIYEWQATNDELPLAITLELEFDHRTVAGGEFNFAFWDPEIDSKVPARGLLALRYTFPGMGEEMLYDAKTGGFASGIEYLNMMVRFGADGFLTGAIYLNDGSHHIDMASEGNLFTVIDADSDEQMLGAGCNWDMEFCGGASGRIRKVGETADIPEPGTLALFGAGLLAALRLRRRAGH